ncbi:MAG: hypothetical protein ACFFCS_06550 [Candidatus Hodarchaeota archaeon]
MLSLDSIKKKFFLEFKEFLKNFEFNSNIFKIILEDIHGFNNEKEKWEELADKELNQLNDEEREVFIRIDNIIIYMYIMLAMDNMELVDDKIFEEFVDVVEFFLNSQNSHSSDDRLIVLHKINEKYYDRNRDLYLTKKYLIRGIDRESKLPIKEKERKIRDFRYFFINCKLFLGLSHLIDKFKNKLDLTFVNKAAKLRRDLKAAIIGTEKVKMAYFISDTLPTVTFRAIASLCIYPEYDPDPEQDIKRHIHGLITSLRKQLKESSVNYIVSFDYIVNISYVASALMLEAMILYHNQHDPSELPLLKSELKEFYHFVKNCIEVSKHDPHIFAHNLDAIRLYEGSTSDWFYSQYYELFRTISQYRKNLKEIDDNVRGPSYFYHGFGEAMYRLSRFFKDPRDDKEKLVLLEIKEIMEIMGKRRSVDFLYWLYLKKEQGIEKTSILNQLQVGEERLSKSSAYNYVKGFLEKSFIEEIKEKNTNIERIRLTPLGIEFVENMRLLVLNYIFTR